jgi:hypothetical protein
MLLLMIAAAWRRARLLPQDGARVPPSHVPLLWAMCLLQPVVRDWGRFSGMVRLNAWPKGRVVWPWPWKRDQPALLFPQPHWWKETFWSEGGIGREALLQSMRHLSPQYDLTWSDGDESSASDATLRLKNGWRHVFVSTVTEFHEQGRSLTRVAFGERHPIWKSRLLFGAGAMLLVTGCFQVSAASWLALILLIVVAWRFRVASKVQSTVQRLVHAAADRCGLGRHEGAEEITPEELHQRLLASAGRSAEL